MSKYFIVLIFTYQPLFCQGQEFILGLPTGHSESVYTAQFSPNDQLVITTSFDNTAKVWETASGRLLYSVKGPRESINNFAQFSPDGRLALIKSSNSGTIRLLDVNQGLIVDTIKLHDDRINSAEFSPDSRYILTASKDRTAKLYNIGNRQVVHVLEGHRVLTNLARFSSNGKLILTTSYDAAKIWDALSGRLIKNLDGHGNYVSFADFSWDTQFIVTATSSDSIRIWNWQSGEVIKTLRSNSSKITDAQFSPNGRLLAGATGDKTVKVWDVSTGNELLTLSGESGWRSLAFSPGGNLIATKLGNDIKIWETTSGRLIQTLTSHASSINSIQFSHNGRFVLTASNDASAAIWDSTSGQILNKLVKRVDGNYLARFSPDNNFVLASSGDESIKLWERRSFDFYSSIDDHMPFGGHSFQHSPDGHLLVSAHNGNSAKIWNTSEGILSQQFNGHDWGIIDVKFDHTGNLIATASADNTAKIWDTSSGKLLHDLNNHEGAILSIQFSSDSEYILTSSDDGTSKLWRTSDGKMLHVLGHAYGSVFSANFSPDDELIVTASNDQTAKIWRTKTGKLLLNLNGHTNSVTTAIFSPDSKKIVTGSEDRTVKMWSVSDGSKLMDLEGHIDEYQYESIRFSPNGQYISSVSWDNSVKIRDGRNGRLVSELIGHADRVTSIQFSSNGRNILTASIDGSVAIWDLEGTKRIQHYYFDEDPMKTLSLTSDGYYRAATDAARLLFYKKGLQTIGFDQLDVKYNRPDKVLEALDNPDTALINAYKKAYQKRIRRLGIDTTSFQEGFSVPQSEFSNRNQIEYTQTQGTVSLNLSLEDSTFLLDRFNIFINEVPVFGSRGLSIRDRQLNQYDTTLTVKLSRGANRIETSVTNVNGIESFKFPLFVQYEPAQPEEKKLYFVGIGIDHFAEQGHDLRYSVKDIRDLAGSFKEKYGEQCIIDTLFNQNVTTEKINTLKSRLQTTSVDDKVVIAYSGHGLLSEQLDYFLSTYSVDFSNPEINGLPYEDLEFLLDSIPSRQKLLLIDACHSGELDREEQLKVTNLLASNENLSDGLEKGAQAVSNLNPVLGSRNAFELMQEVFVNVKNDIGANIISAAGGTQFAYEKGDLANGVFTYSILQYMKNHDSFTVQELKQYVIEQVERLTNGAQRPTSRAESTNVDWLVWE